MRSRIPLLTLLLAVTAHAEVVRYGDFGAKGDGKTDDQAALAKAHEHANRNGLAVRADDGATYYIGAGAQPIEIQTDTDFGNAKFLIDDRKVENAAQHVFKITSIHKPIKGLEVKSLKRGQVRIPVSLPGPCLVMVKDDSVKRFIRRGKNQNAGKEQTDVFLVDAAGLIDPKTPLLWDFQRIDSIVASLMDETPLTIRGGRFTTIANALESTAYHARGIAISRSNVVVENMEHHITGEGKQGPPYRGFLNISNCANVTIRDTVLTGHRTYHKIGSAGQRVPMGSYDISMHGAINITLRNVTQTNDIMDRKYWGIIGTNFCKNLHFENCALSRFDAHMGVTNATIRKSTIGHMGVLLTGFGEFLIEDSTVHGNNMITLRPDYGSTWNGSITIRRCKFLPNGGGGAVLGGSNDGQHDFGYVCHMPERVVIDSLHIEDGKARAGDPGPFLIGDFNPRRKDESYKEKFPYQVTRSVAYRKVTTASGNPVRPSENPYMLRDVEVRR